MKKPIQIFTPGKHTASNGVALDFTEAQLSASAAAYDPAKHEAPIVVGHPTHDAPAYGWVKSLSYADGLEAEPHQVDPAFAEMFAAGRYKKISASFYMPDSPNNPVPGVYYLRHVGCLGAQPPAVKGLRNPEFNETEKGVIEFADFADYDDMTVAALFRRLRDWMIGEKGITVADNIIPDYQVSSLEQSAQAEPDDSTSNAPGVLAGGQYSEKTQPTKGDEMSVEDKARLATLEVENAKLIKAAADFAEVTAKAERTARHTEHVAFAETLIKAGKLLPAHREVTVANLDFIANQEAVVEFGEGDAKKPLFDMYKTQLTELPKIVEFAELAGGEGVIEDKELDPSVVAKAAVEFQEAESKEGRNINTAQAVEHVKAKLQGKKT